MVEIGLITTKGHIICLFIAICVHNIFEDDIH